jgi:hypothetical protein
LFTLPQNILARPALAGRFLNFLLIFSHLSKIFFYTFACKSKVCDQNTPISEPPSGEVIGVSVHFTSQFRPQKLQRANGRKN